MTAMSHKNITMTYIFMGGPMQFLRNFFALRKFLPKNDPLNTEAFFEKRLSHAIHQAVSNGTKAGILYCNLNEFKQLNDKYGKSAGDRVLVEVSKRLKSCFSSNGTVVHFGNDEFVIIVESLTDKTYLHKIAQKLKQKIAEPINESRLSTSASIGIALFPQDGLAAQQLLTIANYDMHHNKNIFYGLVD